MKYSIAVLLLCLALPGVMAEETFNALNEKEAREGWLLLFDGETSFGWSKPADSKWTIYKGIFAAQGEKASHIVTTSAFGDYDLKFQFRTKLGKPAELWIGLDPNQPVEQPKDPIQRTTLDSPGTWTRASIKVRGGAIVEGEFASLGGAVGTGFATARKTQPAKPGPLAIAGSNFVLRNIRLRPVGAKSLFNGKDLTGWKIHPDRKSKFNVTEDGEIRIQDGPGDLQTKDVWSDFLLQLECKTAGDRLNSGVFFRCLPDLYQQGYESQIQNGFTEEAKKEYTVDVYDPKTHELKEKQKVKSRAMDFGTGAIYRRIPARKEVAKDKRWFTMTVLAHGRHIATWVDGVQVVDWTDHRPINENARQGCRLKAGAISFQGHDPTTDLYFRNIRIVDLAK